VTGRFAAPGLTAPTVATGKVSILRTGATASLLDRDRLIASIVTRTAVPADERQRLFICGVMLAATWLLASVDTSGAEDAATTTPTTQIATTSTAPDSLTALDVLTFITVENERQSGYDRNLFHEGLDADGDGCATRAEVLIRDTLALPQVDPFGCHVVAGEWLSVYDGVTVTDPALLA
jgi:hypothetical protein